MYVIIVTEVIILNNMLFKDIENPDDIIRKFKHEFFPKDSYIHQQGDRLEYICIIVSGKIEISKYDISGNKIIVNILEEDEMFAESVAVSKNNISPFNIKAIENSEIIKIKPDSLLEISPKIVYNLMKIMASKNVFFSKKISCISQNSIRKRVFEYFKILSYEQGSKNIKLHLNKSQLAQYLCVDRSALSRELKKMEEEGYFGFGSGIYSLSDNYF